MGEVAALVISYTVAVVGIMGPPPQQPRKHEPTIEAQAPIEKPPRVAPWPVARYKAPPADVPRCTVEGCTK